MTSILVIGGKLRRYNGYVCLYIQLDRASLVTLGSRRSPGEGNGNPLQYSCLGNPMDRGAWQAAVHGVPKSWT